MPFEVPSSWEWTTLGEICSIKGGKRIPKGKAFSKEKTDHVYLRVTDMKNNTIIMSDLRYIDDDVFSEIESYTINSSDLYLTIAGTIGAVGIVPETVNGMNLTENAAKLTNISCDKMYLMYSLLSTIAQEHFSSRFHQVAQPKLSIETASKTPIPLPPIEEQERVVVEIEKWLALIETIESGKTDLQATIKQTKCKILDLAIHGKLVPQDLNDEPASELLKRINPAAEITCDNGQYGKIPENWRVCKLVDICSFLSRGKSPKYSDDDKTYPVFAQKCNLKDGGISIEQARFLDPSTINKWNDVYKLQTGDILVNSTGTGTVGRTRLFNTNCLGNYPFVVPDSHVSVIRVLKSICPQYIFAFISSNSIQQYMEENLAGSTNQKELYIGVLENMQIFLPPLTEQYRIVAKIEGLFSSLDNIQKSLEV